VVLKVMVVFDDGRGVRAAFRCLGREDEQMSQHLSPRHISQFVQIGRDPVGRLYYAAP